MVRRRRTVRVPRGTAGRIGRAREFRTVPPGGIPWLDGTGNDDARRFGRPADRAVRRHLNFDCAGDYGYLKTCTGLGFCT